MTFGEKLKELPISKRLSTRAIFSTIAEVMPELKNKIKENFEKGLELYRAQQWKEAFMQFQLNVKKYNDFPSIVFSDRIKHFKKNPPPENWDGVFVMKAK